MSTDPLADQASTTIVCPFPQQTIDDYQIVNFKLMIKLQKKQTENYLNKYWIYS